MTACVARELREEIGWRQSFPQPVLTDDVDWAVFALELPWGTSIVVDGGDHAFRVVAVFTRSEPAGHGRIPPHREG